MNQVISVVLTAMLLFSGTTPIFQPGAAKSAEHICELVEASHRDSYEENDGTRQCYHHKWMQIGMYSVYEVQMKCPFEPVKCKYFQLNFGYLVECYWCGVTTFYVDDVIHWHSYCVWF